MQNEAVRVIQRTWLRRRAATRSCIVAHRRSQATAAVVRHGRRTAVSRLTSAQFAPIAVEQSPLVGFGRVAAMELPDLRPRLVDLDRDQFTNATDEAADSHCADELQNQNHEGEVAYRDGKRYVARLVRSSVDRLAERDESESAAAGDPARAVPTCASRRPARSMRCKFAPVEREPPAAGQVEIEVRATGLNFSDVLKALGLYPGIKDAIVPLGIEASGVVTAVGEGVDRFKVGDEVFGVVPYAFASHARTAEYALVHKPKSIDHDAACTIPITFLTAYYGLVRLAQLQPGERVLIHAGAGGVGLAAIQIAQQIGAEVFATAGSEAKRDFLRSLGVEARLQQPLDRVRRGNSGRHRSPRRRCRAQLAPRRSDHQEPRRFCAHTAGSWKSARPTSIRTA